MPVIARMIGNSNKGNISGGLINSGSMISSISRSFYNSLEPTPVLDVSIYGHRLSVVTAAGNKCITMAILKPLCIFGL